MWFIANLKLIEFKNTTNCQYSYNVMILCESNVIEYKQWYYYEVMFVLNNNDATLKNNSYIPVVLCIAINKV